MHPSETVFCLLRDDPIRTIFWHPDSALREVCVVGRAGVDAAGSVAARLWRLFDPSDRYGVYVLLAGHWQLVAARYPSHKNQHGQYQVNSGGEFDVLSHDQNVAIPGNCEPTSRSTVRQSASLRAVGSGTTQPSAPLVGKDVPSKFVPILAPVTAVNDNAVAAVAACTPRLRITAVPAESRAVITNGTPATIAAADVRTMFPVPALEKMIVPLVFK